MARAYVRHTVVHHISHTRDTPPGGYTGEGPLFRDYHVNRKNPDLDLPLGPAKQFQHGPKQTIQRMPAKRTSE